MRMMVSLLQNSAIRVDDGLSYCSGSSSDQLQMSQDQDKNRADVHQYFPRILLALHSHALVVVSFCLMDLVEAVL